MEVEVWRRVQLDIIVCTALAISMSNRNATKQYRYIALFPTELSLKFNAKSPTSIYRIARNFRGA